MGDPGAGLSASAHLVGSVPLAAGAAVFRAVSAALGPYLRRIPDGETGERRRWIFFQSVMLKNHPMPRDIAVMVEIANDVRRDLARAVDFLRLPVPKHRTDAAYFRPLTRLEGFGDSTLYLGLIHHDDRDGDRARMAAARAFVPAFGVASECGWGRTDPARVPSLLESHRVAVEPLDGVSVWTHFPSATRRYRLWPSRVSSQPLRRSPGSLTVSARRSTGSP